LEGSLKCLKATIIGAYPASHLDRFHFLIPKKVILMSTKHNHSSENERRRGHGHGGAPFWKNLHRDWRVWAAVFLMLAAMVIYVMTDDESLQPGSAQQQSVPAADGI
jgi:hypothetical protein